LLIRAYGGRSTPRFAHAHTHGYALPAPRTHLRCRSRRATPLPHCHPAANTHVHTTPTAQHIAFWCARFCLYLWTWFGPWFQDGYYACRRPVENAPTAYAPAKPTLLPLLPHASDASTAEQELTLLTIYLAGLLLRGTRNTIVRIMRFAGGLQRRRHNFMQPAYHTRTMKKACPPQCETNDACHLSALPHRRRNAHCLQVLLTRVPTRVPTICTLHAFALLHMGPPGG